MITIQLILLAEIDWLLKIKHNCFTIPYIYGGFVFSPPTTSKRKRHRHNKGPILTPLTVTTGRVRGEAVNLTHVSQEREREGGWLPIHECE